MTDGEKMVWAAAFALALREHTSGIYPHHAHQIAHACQDADAAVAALRAAPRSPMSDAMRS